MKYTGHLNQSGWMTYSIVHVSVMLCYVRRKILLISHVETSNIFNNEVCPSINFLSSWDTSLRVTIRKATNFPTESVGKTGAVNYCYYFGNCMHTVLLYWLSRLEIFNYRILPSYMVSEIDTYSRNTRSFFNAHEAENVKILRRICQYFTGKTRRFLAALLASKLNHKECWKLLPFLFVLSIYLYHVCDHKQ